MPRYGHLRSDSSVVIPRKYYRYVKTILLYIDSTDFLSSSPSLEFIFRMRFPEKDHKEIENIVRKWLSQLIIVENGSKFSGSEFNTLGEFVRYLDEVLHLENPYDHYSVSLKHHLYFPRVSIRHSYVRTLASLRWFLSGELRSNWVSFQYKRMNRIRERVLRGLQGNETDTNPPEIILNKESFYRRLNSYELPRKYRNFVIIYFSKLVGINPLDLLDDPEFIEWWKEFIKEMRRNHYEIERIRNREKEKIESLLHLIRVSPPSVSEYLKNILKSEYGIEYYPGKQYRINRLLNRIAFNKYDPIYGFNSITYIASKMRIGRTTLYKKELLNIAREIYENMIKYGEVKVE